MRLALVAAPLLLAACSSDPGVAFTLVAGFQAETDGVVLHDDAATGDAAMADQICVFDTRAAEVVADLDVSDGHERLLDARGANALVGGETQVFVTSRDGVNLAVDDVVDLYAIDGRILDDGLALLTSWDGACAVAFDDGTTTNVWMVPGTRCDGEVAFTADRATGVAWIADGASLATVAPDGSTTRWDQAGADLLAYDRGADRLLVGATGEDWLQGVDLDGTVAWTATLDGALHDLDVAGGAGLSAIMVDQPRGAALALLDDASGEGVAVHPLPSSAGLTFSDDGRSMGLVTDEIVYLYDVDTDARMFDLPGVSRVEKLSPWGGIGRTAGGAAAILGTAVLVSVIVD